MEHETWNMEQNEKIVLLYVLCYVLCILSRWPDLNRRPTPYHGVALPLSYIGTLCPSTSSGHFALQSGRGRTCTCEEETSSDLQSDAFAAQPHAPTFKFITQKLMLFNDFVMLFFPFLYFFVVSRQEHSRDRPNFGLRPPKFFCPSKFLLKFWQVNKKFWRAGVLGIFNKSAGFCYSLF